VSDEDANYSLSIKYIADHATFHLLKHQYFQLEEKLRGRGLRFNTMIRRKKDAVNLEVLPEKADKGKALEYICENYLQCHVQQVVAFGDSLNDCSMLEVAGRAYLVSNSQQEFIEWYERNKQLTKFHHI